MANREIQSMCVGTRRLMAAAAEEAKRLIREFNLALAWQD
jgi:hypothetical protein